MGVGAEEGKTVYVCSAFCCWESRGCACVGLAFIQRFDFQGPRTKTVYPTVHFMSLQYNVCVNSMLGRQLVNNYSYLVILKTLPKLMDIAT